MTDTLVNRCLAMSRRIKDNRSVPDVQYKLTEEFGELGQELLIAAGKHYKMPGKDGVIGEALDMIVCLIDMIYHHQNDVTEEQLAEMIQKKLDKWAEKSEQMLPGCTVERPAFHDILTVNEEQIDPNYFALTRRDGSTVFLTRAEFMRSLYSLERNQFKGRYIYTQGNVVTRTHVVFGDIDHASNEEE
jgi:hypothetical protein